MNKKHLHNIFNKYIEKFEILNNEKNDETYKWEIAQEFQKFDVDAEDFAVMLNHMWKTSANLIDSSHQLPFYALVDYADKEPETVRMMFKKLYAEEIMDDDSKQKIIDEFIASSEELRKKYYPDSHLYINNQRSVMMYLFLRYPNSNYGYKAGQAKSFADCIEFYDDWGPMSNFNLNVFSRMCEQIIDEMKEHQALMTIHKSRYNTKRSLHPDENLHILALDIIYSSQAYNFYDDMSFETINAQVRKLYFERVKKAKELAVKLEKAKKEMEELNEAKEYIKDVIVKGLPVKHKKLGEGTIIECTGTAIVAEFPLENEIKKYGIGVVVSNGLLTFNSEETTKKIKEYAKILSREGEIPVTLARLEKEIEQYLEYLE